MMPNIITWMKAPRYLKIHQYTMNIMNNYVILPHNMDNFNNFYLWYIQLSIPHGNIERQTDDGVEDGPDQHDDGVEDVRPVKTHVCCRISSLQAANMNSTQAISESEIKKCFHYSDHFCVIEICESMMKVYRDTSHAAASVILTEMIHY